MARSTKIEATETRNRIIDAAERVFHAQGVSRTSLEDVAQAAEVTRGAIYWHFKNKGDLFDAMSQRVKLPMEAMVQAGSQASQLDPLGQMRSSLIFVLQETALNPRSKMVFDIIFLKCEFVDANDSIRSRQQEGCSKALMNFARTMENAILRQQLPRDLDIPLACRMVQSTLVGLINSWLFMPGSLDLAAEAPRLVDACLDMVRYAPALRKPASVP
ncbi:MAG: TetR family transcriptional regulator [Pseudomonadota bacterium]